MSNDKRKLLKIRAGSIKKTVIHVFCLVTCSKILRYWNFQTLFLNKSPFMSCPLSRITVAENTKKKVKEYVQKVKTKQTWAISSVASFFSTLEPGAADETGDHVVLDEYGEYTSKSSSCVSISTTMSSSSFSHAIFFLELELSTPLFYDIFLL